MTFSIVAVDREQNEAGLAIASCCWDAGQVCMAWHDLGAIASQASGNLAFLGTFRDRIAAGDDLDAVQRNFRSIDEAIETRQIGMVSPSGGAYAFTGKQCAPWAGHRAGENYACQGNILVGPQVIDAMTEAFQATDGPLYKRLYAALSAGDDAGGDRRGRQSARLAVKKPGYGQPGTDTFIDISIEDHESPVGEIGRVLGVGEELMTILGMLGTFSEAADNDKPGILHELRTFLDDKRHCRHLDWWESLASNYYEIGEVDRAIEAYQVYLEINPGLSAVLQHGVDAGTFPAELASQLNLSP